MEKSVGFNVICPVFLRSKTILNKIASLEFKPPRDPPTKKMFFRSSDSEGLFGHKEKLDLDKLISFTATVSGRYFRDILPSTVFISLFSESTLTSTKIVSPTKNSVRAVSR